MELGDLKFGSLFKHEEQEYKLLRPMSFKPDYCLANELATCPARIWQFEFNEPILVLQESNDENNNPNTPRSLYESDN